MLVLEADLQTRLSGIREQAASHTENNLGTNDAGAGIARDGTSVADQQAEANQVQGRADDDEGLEAAHLVDNKAEKGSDNDAHERVQRGDPGSGVDTKVKGDDQDGVEVVGLHAVGEVEQEGDAHGRPDAAVLHQDKGHQGMGSPELPDDEYGYAKETNNQRCDDMGRLPLTVEAAGESQRHQDQGEDGNEQDDADDVEQPEELARQALEAEHLEGGAVVVQAALAASAARDEPQAEDERQGADGIDDAPHADAPVPGGGAQDSLGDVAADPGVDDEGQGGQVAEEEAGARGGDVGDDDLDQQDDHGVADLVDDAAAGVGGHIGGDGLDDGAQHVEEDGQAHQLDAAEDVGDLGRRGLGRRGDDGTHDVDGRGQRVAGEGRRGIGLVGVAQGAVQPVGVGHQEHAREDEDAVAQRHGRRERLHARHAGRLGHVPGVLGRGHGRRVHLSLGGHGSGREGLRLGLCRWGFEAGCHGVGGHNVPI